MAAKAITAKILDNMVIEWVFGECSVDERDGLRERMLDDELCV